jgi:glycosyltransferase involved in cell wall biosynthesis
MKVSIVTAVRNGAGAMRVTLESVAQQSWQDLEHVIVDGASTDATLDVVRRYPARLGAVVSERDSGVYDAFNKGLKLATGDFIVFLGAGDCFSGPRAVEKLVLAAQAAGTGVAFADLAIVDPATGRLLRHYRSSRFTPGRIASGYMPAHPTMLIHRSIYAKFGGYNASYRVAGDFELVVRALGLGQTAYVHVPETLVLMEAGGLSNRGWRSKWIITKEMHRACRENGVPTSWLRLLSRLPAKYAAEVLAMREARR